MSKKIETDLATFAKFWLVPLFIVAIVFLVYKALDGLIMVGISIFLALALKPLVRKVDGFFNRHFGKDKKHQTISVVMAYLIVVLALGSIIAIVGPVVVNETAKFVGNFPTMFENSLGGWDGINNFGKNLGIADLQNEITTMLAGISDNLVGMLGNNLMTNVSVMADVMMRTMLVLVMTLLFLLQGPAILDKIWDSLDRKEDRKGPIKVARRVVYKMSNVVSLYVSRQVIVAILDGVVAGVMVFILSLILGFSSTLSVPMGMITMTFYLIPMFGQFIGGTLVTVLLLFSNPIAALVFAIIYIIYAQIENNLIAPKIQGDALQLEPLIILIAIVIGMYMFGLLGAIIAIPIAGCIKVLVDEFPNIRALKD